VRLYPLGPISPRFQTISAATNANPIVITTSAPHGFSLSDVITIGGITGNTNANGTYANAAGAQSFTVTATTITLLNKAGNGTFGGTAIASAPQQLIKSPRYPATMAEFPDVTQARAAKMLFTPAPAGTATLYVGGVGLNQATLDNVFRPINPPPTTGIFDFYELDEDGTNIFNLSDYWIDAAKPGTEAVLVSFWVR
jgi:hypothetical protein